MLLFGMTLFDPSTEFNLKDGSICLPKTGRTTLTRGNIENAIRSADDFLSLETRKVAQAISSLAADPQFPDTAPRAYLVGGFVRDLALNRESKDSDLEVYGVSAGTLIRVLQQLYPDRVNLVGAQFGVLKVALGNGLDLDIAIPRRESKTGNGHRDFEIVGDPALSSQEACRRRDFTMNALMADPLTGEVIDHFGGLEDLQNGLIRVTDPNTFKDDPLRVYRAVQFAARLSFSIEHKSFSFLHEMVARGDLGHLPAERVTEELKKLLLKSPKPSVGLELMKVLGITERYFPELHALIGVPQEPEWHPEGDVWIHTMMVTDAAANLVRSPERNFSEEQALKTILGSLVHDFGKPATTKEINGRILAHEHDEGGVAPALAFMNRLSFPKFYAELISQIVRRHLAPALLLKDLDRGKMAESSYRRAAAALARKFLPEDLLPFLTVCEADSRGRAFPDALTKPYLPGSKFMEALAFEASKSPIREPLLSGQDILDLGHKPGPNVGIIMKRVAALRDDGTIETKEEALKFVKENY